MKKILVFLLTLSLLLSFTLPSFASHTVSRRLNDGAGLLNASEAQELGKELDRLSEKWDMDVAVVTVSSLDGDYPSSYAYRYYNDAANGFGTDGVLLLIAMQSRDYYVYSSGYGETAFTYAGLEYLCDRVAEELSEGEYADAIEEYAEQCDDYIAQAKKGKPYDDDNMPKAPFDLVKNLLISIGIGLFIGLVVAFGMKSALKTERRRYGAVEYVDKKGLKVTHASDIYLYSTLTRVRRQQNNGGGMHSSSGGGGGGRGGKF